VTRRWLTPRLAGLLAAVFAVAAVLAGPPPTALAATPDLTLVTSARYEVVPEEGRVAITVDMTATNRLQDTVTRQFYFDRAYVAVMPGTSNFRLSADGSSPRVVVESRQTAYWLLRLEFGTRLPAGKSLGLQLRFDLKDPGGAPTRPIRIGPTLVSFPVWAFGTPETAGSSVAVTFPADYQVEISAGRLTGPRTEADGRRTWTSGTLSDALAFSAFVVADRPGAYAESSRTVDVGGAPAALVLRAWPDDPDWAKRVGGLFERGLPVLGSQIGLTWPIGEPLVVQEAVSRTSGGYAGLFDAEARKVEVAYYAGSLVVLHEAAHAWFNGHLLADRWANEAFASRYAVTAAAAIGEKVTPDVLTPELQAKAAPLNGWGAVGEVAPDTEDYFYAAGLELARLIAERAGEDGLRAVWAAAASGEAAYQPPGGAAERVDGPPDWRGLLDLLERGGTSYEDLWHDWVARPEDIPLLEARAGARIEYASVLAAAGDWRRPRSIREALRAWRFDAAGSQLQAARAVLEQRDRIALESADLGLTPPPGLRAAFEQDGALDAAMKEAGDERTAIAAVRAAVATRPSQPDIADQVGLIGVTPDVDLEAARTAFAAGRLQEAGLAADRARLAWLSASGLGRNRLTSAGLIALAAVVAIWVWLGRRRRPAAAERPITVVQPRPMSGRFEPPPGRPRDGGT
jgi:hypothetical protein